MPSKHGRKSHRSRMIITLLPQPIYVHKFAGLLQSLTIGAEPSSADLLISWPCARSCRGLAHQRLVRRTPFNVFCGPCVGWLACGVHAAASPAKRQFTPNCGLVRYRASRIPRGMVELRLHTPRTLSRDTRTPAGPAMASSTACAPSLSRGSPRRQTAILSAFFCPTSFIRDKNWMWE